MRISRQGRQAIVAVLLILQLSPGFSLSVCPDEDRSANHEVPPAAAANMSGPCPSRGDSIFAEPTAPSSPSDDCTTVEVASTCGTCTLVPTPPQLALSAPFHDWHQAAGSALPTRFLSPEPRPPST